MSENSKDYSSRNIKARLLSSQRINVLDLARIMAMFMMIQGHTFDALANPAEMDLSNFPWSLWAYVRRFTSPVFLMVSGAVQVFANKRDDSLKVPKATIFRRVRFAVVLIIIGYMFVCPVTNAFDLFYINKTVWAPFLQIGILQIIGVSLIFVLIIFMLTRKDKTLGIASFIIAMLIFFSSSFIHHIDWFAILPEGLAAYLSFNHGSMFTLAPYSGFMFLGVTLGTILKQIDPENRPKFLLFAGIPVGIAFILIGFQLYNIWFYHFPFVVEMKTNPGIIFNQVGTVFLVLSFAVLIFLLTKKISFYYAFFGKKALFIYIVHLLLIFGTPWNPGLGKLYHKSLSIAVTALLALIVEAVSFMTAYLYEIIINKFPVTKLIYRWLIIAVIAYFLVIGRLVIFIINGY
ncbi:MAG: heparan-alpha-glucosaminide N-acetyltransferase domain-containing protein [Bacteroidota bacterium]